VLVSGRPSAYDRIECAERGRVLAAAGGAAFAHPFKARTILIDAPRTAAAAAASVGVAGSLLARASLARARLAFGGVWLLATGLAATSFYLSARPDSGALSTDSGAAEAPTGVEEPASSVPFVHQADLPPVRPGGPPPKKPAEKPKSQPLLVRNDPGNQSSPVATPSAPPPPQPAPSPAPTPEPPPPPPAIQPVEPPPPAVPAAPPVPAPVGDDDADDDDEDSTKPGWGHGDDNHEHGGPPGKSDD
jgi:hypothetical protein